MAASSRNMLASCACSWTIRSTGRTRPHGQQIEAEPTALQIDTGKTRTSFGRGFSAQ
jgi:hypothetical protein